MRLLLLLAVCVATAYGQGCVSEANIEGCGECENPAIECVECRPDYWWKDEFTCLACPAYCLSCTDSNRDDVTECLECADFYYKTDDDTCEFCAGHCMSCTGDFQCSKCGPGYRSDGTAVIECVGCSTGCAQCLDGATNACTECHEGYYYTRRYLATETRQESGICTACGSRCESCKSGTTCDRCERGTTWTGSACTSCITNCDADFCETNGACKQCVEGYFLTTSAHQCRSCAHCADCPLTGGCITCEDGYILLEDGTCQACPDIDSAAVCTECGTDDRARVFLASTCDYCPENCALCTATDSCSQCIAGYYRNADNLCSQCDASCLTCSDAGSDNCLSCEDGQTVRGGVCQECPTATDTPNCAECNSGTCTGCDTNFYLVRTETTDAFECRSCTGLEANRSRYTCSECAPASRGRYMPDEKCRQCNGFNAQCMECTATACTLCEDMFYVNGGNCESCTLSNCVHCSDTSTCTECLSNFYVDDNDECARCPDNCDDCDDAFTCNQCIDGDYIEYDALCTECMVDHCEDCDGDITMCTECEDGYIVNGAGTACEECSAGCAICTATDNCMTCQAHYYKDGSNACVECGVDNCDDCSYDPEGDMNDAGTQARYTVQCTDCGPGKYKVRTPHCFPNGVVGGGTTNCDMVLASDTSVCETCSTNYYRDSNGMCMQCTDTTNCDVCDPNNPAHCLKCNDGHTSDGGTCQACTGGTNCGTCALGALATCTTCPDNMYEMTAGSCDGTCADCALCGSDGTCYVCDDGFYNNDGTCVACEHPGSAAGNCATCAVGDGTNTVTDCTTCATAAEILAGDGSCGVQVDGNGDCDIVECVMCDSANCAAGKCGPANEPSATSTCDVCVTDCFSCDTSNPGQCELCQDGFYLEDATTCTACSPAIQNCARCGQDGMSCTLCNVGYYPSADLRNCNSACSTANCKHCFDNECTECNTGFGLSYIDTCEDCGTNCMECVNADVCITCNVGYLLDSATKTCSANKCVEHCTSCMNSNTCNANMCEDGYFGGNCDACEGNCRTCDSNTDCTACNAGYTLDAMDCHVCAPNCGNCDTNLYECDACLDGYAETNICSDCPSNCKTCTAAMTLGDPATCTLCMPTYYPNNDGSACMSCSESDCNVCLNDACTECSNGFELVDGSCTAESASADFPNCADEDDGVCVRCDANYYLDPDTNLCQSCSTDGPDAAEYVCNGCAGASVSTHVQYQSWQATCNDCVENCVRCTSATNCEECVSGRYWDGTACQTLVCTNLDGITHETACTACSDFNYDKDDEHQGLFWTGSACQECPRNCETCTTATSCASCETSFAWSATENACVPCNFDSTAACEGCASSSRGRYVDSDNLCRLCDEHCTRCSDSSSTCTACESSYFLSGTSCIICTSADITAEGCASCQQTYAAWANNVHAWMTAAAVEGVEPTQGCLECPTNCMECSVINTCTTCFGSRYFFSDAETSTYECRDCLTNCFACSNANECVECNSGYYYVEGATNTCTLCPSNCHTCTHNDGCTICDAGFYLAADKTCVACNGPVSNCIACGLVGEDVVCSDCSLTYYPGEGGSECISCIANCNDCNDGTTCNDCQENYCYDSSVSPAVCRSNSGVNCDTCELLGDTTDVTCLTCVAGYFIQICEACDDGQCLACDEGANICTQCRTGYYLSEGANGVVTCAACPFLCPECTTGEACPNCGDGLYWNAETLQCAPCLSGCASCTNGQTCNQCIYENTFKDTSGETHACTTCVTGCLSCTNEEDCSLCLPGYRMVLAAETMIFESCQACNLGCLNCTFDEVAALETCTGCAPGYELIEGSCVACSEFASCVDCFDVDENGLIDAGDCLECAPGFLLNDEESACVSCTIVGCQECIDRGYICLDCLNDQLPSPDEFYCGDPCWFCYDDEACEMAPELNGTEPVAGSPYIAVGCQNGCWSTRIEDSTGVHYTKGCMEDTEVYSCSAYTTEFCQNFGEEGEEFEECAICCTGELCNTEAPVGETAGAAAIAVSLTLLMAAILALMM